jgi:hypothetical protein
MAAAVEAAGGRKASCFFEVGRREIGSSFPRASSRRISGSEVLFFSVLFFLILALSNLRFEHVCWVDIDRKVFALISLSVG